MSHDVSHAPFYGKDVVFLITAYYTFKRLRVYPIMDELLLYGKRLLGIKANNYFVQVPLLVISDVFSYIYTIRHKIKPVALKLRAE